MGYYGFLIRSAALQAVSVRQITAAISKVKNHVKVQA